MKWLKELIEGFKTRELINFHNISIEGIAYDSRKVKPDFLFVCITGLREDGHRFAAEAVKRGAAAIVCERIIEGEKKIPQIVVAESRCALSHISAIFYHHPSREIYVTGITGTNGKTSTSFLCEAILKQIGETCGVIGTINYRWGDRILPAEKTTPESLETQQILREMFKGGCRHAIIEVSSHALEQERVRDVEFRTGIFTNLSTEHLDYHGTLERYLKAKAKLFEKLKGKETTAIINIDDPHSSIISKLPSGRIITYGIEKKAEVMASNILSSPEGMSFLVRTSEGSLKMQLKLLGKGNVYNTLAAAGFAISVGVELPDIKTAFEGVGCVRGRFEVVWKEDFTVVIDYAHTPQAMEMLLQSARSIVPGRIITVFGCGGDRDKTKRPLMGGISAEMADFSFLTTDNPRSEDPETIISQIQSGFQKLHKTNFRIIPDRAEAIREAINFARNGDMVIIAGKGHETYQTWKDWVVPFDDSEVAREALEGLHGSYNC